MKKNGFSLLELVIVLVVLAIGLTTLLMVITNASGFNVSANFIVVGSGLAQERMEQIISDRGTQSFSYIQNSNYPNETPVTGMPNYNRAVNIIYVTSSALNTQSGSSTNYKRIEVSVTGPASDQTIRLVSLVTNY